MHLQTKIALVTGAGAGIGRAVAVELARCGATVVVNYRRIESGARETLVLIEQVSSTGLLYQADIARSVETQKLMGEIASRFGRLDILVNNASGLVQRAKISE